MFTKLLHRFIRDDAAPSAVEYALLVAGVAVTLFAVVYVLGAGAHNAFDKAAPVSPPSTASPSAR
jgi:Flp pilus assembly pilin Flp